MIRTVWLDNPPVNAVNRVIIDALWDAFESLDDETREEMYALLKSVQQRTNVTVLHVTHHLAEAQRLGDTILTLTNGRIIPKVQ